MNIKMDNIYLIGNDHTVCQDYSYSGLINQIPYIIISDGCSQAKNSDIGARLLVHSIKNFFDKHFILDNIDFAMNNFPGILNDYIMTLKKLIKMKFDLFIEDLDLNNDVTYATIRFACIVNNKLILINFGDGYSILSKNGVEISRIYTRFESNAPFYLSYFINDLVDQYIRNFPNEEIECNGSIFNVRDYINRKENFLQIINLDTLEDGEYCISVMSDGVDTFFNNGDKIPVDEIIKSLTEFKNTNGTFVERRVRKYVLQCVKNNVKHYDDISIASMIFNIENGKIK